MNNYKVILDVVAMASIVCPECDANIEAPSDSVSGEILACPDCGQSYEIRSSDGNLTLKPAEAIGEDWGQ